eukprot:GFUD01131981.1.p1 GENE.GFUD01131981.1~~GFUD01131981.1.p1  ORF type:complete len:527 (-),score=102.25 GFUD01131981.1:408-1988(-)
MLMFAIFLLHLLHTALCQGSTEQAIKTLMSLLQPKEARGDPFPTIPGPAQYEQVCIVGAGPAGIHMAQSLKKIGFTNITIYEKTNRVGGKSYDIKYRGIEHPQGTIFAEANYFDNLIPLALEYGAGDYVKIPSYNVWRTNSAQDENSKLMLSQFILGRVAPLTNSTNPKANLGFLLKTAIHYVKLHKQMFGDYEGDLMLRPDEDVMFRIRGTFLEYLKRENMLALVPVFKLSNELQGYGHLDEVSALYGLIWNNPKFVITLTLRALKQDNDPLSVYVLRDGFEKIWKNIVQKENLDIRFNTDIYSITRLQNRVALKIWKGSYLKPEHCDFMIWTPPMSDLLRTLTDTRHEEYNLFKGLKPEFLTASLVDMRNSVRNGPYSAFMYNLDRKVEGGVTGEASMMGFLTPDIGTPEGIAEYNGNQSQLLTISVLQLGKECQDEKTLNQILQDHYTKGFNATDLEILNTITWPYFPRWSPEETGQARHWQVFNMQGKQKVWYAGSSVSFESIRGVMEYNNLLLRKMNKINH